MIGSPQGPEFQDVGFRVRTARCVVAGQLWPAGTADNSPPRHQSQGVHQFVTRTRPEVQRFEATLHLTV